MPEYIEAAKEATLTGLSLTNCQAFSGLLNNSATPLPAALMFSLNEPDADLTASSTVGVGGGGAGVATGVVPAKLYACPGSGGRINDISGRKFLSLKASCASDPNPAAFGGSAKILSSSPILLFATAAAFTGVGATTFDSVGSGEGGVSGNFCPTAAVPTPFNASPKLAPLYAPIPAMMPLPRLPVASVPTRPVASPAWVADIIPNPAGPRAKPKILGRSLPKIPASGSPVSGLIDKLPPCAIASD